MWFENLNVLSIIGTIVAVVIVACIFLFHGKKEQAKKIVLALVVEAESKFGAGTGSLKYAYVLGKVYPLLPAIVRLFISEDALDKMIEAGVDLLKNKLQPAVKPSATASMMVGHAITQGIATFKDGHAELTGGVIDASAVKPEAVKPLETVKPTDVAPSSTTESAK